MKRKRTKEVSFIPFLIITVGLLVSIAFFVFRFSSQDIETDHVVDVYEALVQEPEKLPELLSTAELTSAYIGDIKELHTTTKEFEGEIIELQTVIEDTLLSVRVPKRHLDQHLQTVLHIRELRTSEETPTKESLLERLTELLDAIDA